MPLPGDCWAPLGVRLVAGAPADRRHHRAGLAGRGRLIVVGPLHDDVGDHVGQEAVLLRGRLAAAVRRARGRVLARRQVDVLVGAAAVGRAEQAAAGGGVDARGCRSVDGELEGEQAVRDARRVLPARRRRRRSSRRPGRPSSCRRRRCRRSGRGDGCRRCRCCRSPASGGHRRPRSTSCRRRTSRRRRWRRRRTACRRRRGRSRRCGRRGRRGPGASSRSSRRTPCGS